MKKKRNRHDKDTFFENLGADGLIIIVTAVVTVIASVVIAFLEEGSVAYNVCDKAFFISLSSLLVEIIWSVSSIKNTVEEIEENTNFAENVIFPDEESKSKQAMEEGYKNPSAQCVRIICYGTSQFGGIIEAINRYYHNLSLEIIVCDPNETIRADRERLMQAVIEMASGRKASVYLSKIPPTIRACLITKKDPPEKNDSIFCMIQPYQIYLGVNRYRGNGQTPIILASNEDSPIIDELSKFFLQEWNRLLKSSVSYTPGTFDAILKESE